MVSPESPKVSSKKSKKSGKKEKKDSKGSRRTERVEPVQDRTSREERSRSTRRPESPPVQRPQAVQIEVSETDEHTSRDDRQLAIQDRPARTRLDRLQSFLTSWYHIHFCSRRNVIRGSKLSHKGLSVFWNSSYSWVACARHPLFS